MFDFDDHQVLIEIGQPGHQIPQSITRHLELEFREQGQDVLLPQARDSAGRTDVVAPRLPDAGGERLDGRESARGALEHAHLYGARERFWVFRETEVVGSRLDCQPALLLIDHRRRTPGLHE